MSNVKNLLARRRHSANRNRAFYEAVAKDVLAKFLFSLGNDKATLIQRKQRSAIVRPFRDGKIPIEFGEVEESGKVLR